MHSRNRPPRPHSVYAEFHLRGQNSRVEPLRLSWKAQESLHYGGNLQVLGGPPSLRARFEKRISDLTWLKNDPNRLAGGRPFTESYYATVAVLFAFAEAEKVVIETAHSPVPMAAQAGRSAMTPSFSDLDDFDRERSVEAPVPSAVSGTTHVTR